MTNKILGPGETWTFRCTGSLEGPSGANVSGTTSKTATGVGHGKDGNSPSADVTYCGTATTPATSESGKICDSDERDKVSVSITYQPRGPNPAP